MRRIVIPAILSALALSLTACAGTGSDSADTKVKPVDEGTTFDFSTIKTDPAVAALVPADIKKRNVLRNGASTDYAPAEFLLTDGTTPTGYEVDMVKAIALTMGLKDGTTTTEAFSGLLPKIGSSYDVGASSFTETPERIKNYDMITYMDMGSLFATGKNNPNKFNPKDVCGTTVGVQTGTYQESELLPKMSKQCQADGKKPVDIKRETNLSDLFPKVVSGQYDAMLADNPVTLYYVKQSNNQMQTAGDVFDSAPVGIVVNNKNQALSKAVKAAMDSLLKSGKLKEIMSYYGADSGLYSEVKIESSVAK